MRLGSVRPGDIVRAGGMHAFVVERRYRELTVRGLANGSTRRLRAADVEAIWLRSPRPYHRHEKAAL